MSATPTEVAHDVTGRTIDLNAEVRRQWGAEWGKPEVEYEFSNGRKFTRRTEYAAIYKPQP
jgi:hypothetical protein